MTPGRRLLRAATPQRTLLLGSLLFGGALVFVTPPFGTPDEPAHLFRAWAISQGDLVGERVRGAGGHYAAEGAAIPAGVARLRDVATAAGTQPVAHPLTGEALARAYAVALDAEHPQFVDFRNSLQLPVALYLPQALGCAAARLAGMPPLAGLYLARLLNLAASTAILLWALARLPAHRWWLVAVAFSPMLLSLRASLSADALNFAFASAFLAEVAALARSSTEPAGGDRARLFLLAAALGCMKVTYLPLILLLFLVPALRRPPGRWRTALPAIGLATLCAAAHLATLAPTQLRLDVPVDSPAQLQRLLHEPFAVLAILLRDLAVHAPRFLAEALGNKLGWLDVPLAPVALVVLSLAFALLIWAEAAGCARPPRRDLALILGSAFAVALLVELALWLQWTPLGDPGVQGVQGRYFLPLALPFIWSIGGVGCEATPSRAGARPTQRERAAAIAAGAALTATFVSAGAAISGLLAFYGG